MGSSVIESARKVNTNNKLDAIEEALLAFRLVNNRLPCPGDATLTDIPANSTTYGYEAGSNAANSPANSCIGGSPAANFSYTVTAGSSISAAAGTTVAEGAVPVKALNLPDEYQWDGWGRKFAYAVWTPLTATNAFLTYGLSPNCGAITVENAGHGYRTTAGAYALISYGSDGHGGYLKSGSHYFMGSDNTDEWTNCHCNATADTGNYAATYVEQDVTQTNPADSYSVFDDIVRFKDRWQMQNAYDTYTPNGAPCTPGFRVDSSGGNNGPGGVAARDFNGDGIPDLVFSQPSCSYCMGAIYVVFGKSTGFVSPITITPPGNNGVGVINGTNGLVITATTAPNVVNLGPVLVADVNGDGYDDLIIGAPGASPNGHTYAGSVFVLYGGPGPRTGPGTYDPSGWPASFDLGTLNGINGFRLDGSVPGSFPQTLSLAVGKVSGHAGGDNHKDIIWGLTGTNSGNGEVYVAFGPTNTSGVGGASVGEWPAELDLGTLTGSYTATNTTGPFGFRINGTKAAPCGGYGYCGFGYSVGAGDVNGDGVDDILVGTPYGSPGYDGDGSVYILFGGPGPRTGNKTWDTTNGWPADFDLTAVNGTNGTRLDNVNNDYGMVIGNIAVADVNSDGIPDLVMTEGSGTSGCSGQNGYVFFGHTDSGSWSYPTTFSQSSLNGSNGFTITGIQCNNSSQASDSVAVGDINKDGRPDIVIGNPGGVSGCGSVWTLFQPSNGAWGASVDLTSLNGSSTGFRVDGSCIGGSNSDAGAAVAVGDINDDGYPDLVVAAPGTAPEANQAGSTYVIYGTRIGWPSVFDLSLIDSNAP